MTSKQRLDWKNELAFIKMKTTKFLIDNTYLETEKKNPVSTEHNYRHLCRNDKKGKIS